MSCNNSKTDTKKDEVTKDDKVNTPSKKGWSDDERKEAMDICERDAMNKDGLSASKANQLCSCLMDIAEEAFSSYDEMKKNPEKINNNVELQKRSDECEAQFSDKKDN